MLRRNLCASIAVCIVVPLSTFSQNAQPRTGTPPKLPVIRSTTRAVNVTVVVTDKKGQPVQGLTKNDFQIFDNGDAEEIALFSTRAYRTTRDDAMRALPPGEYSNDPHRLGKAKQGATVILFDTANTTYLSQAYNLERIRVFLRRKLRPQDRVGIYVLDRHGLKVVYDPRRPAAAILDAMQRYDYKSAAGSKATAATASSTELAELERFLRGKDDQNPLLPNSLTKCEPEQLQVTMAAFQEIARSIAGLEGRKTVIWVTERMPWPLLMAGGNALRYSQLKRFCGTRYETDLLPEDPASLRQVPGLGRPPSNEPLVSVVQDSGLSENDELDLLLRLMNENNIALYPMNANGLLLQTVPLFGPGGMDSTAFIADQERMTEAVLDAQDAASLDSASAAGAHRLMERLARHTGGRAYYRRDLETGIRRALDDSRYGYELAYYPDHDRWNGEWRKIEVLVNRPEVAVLARAGYYAFPEPKLLPPKASKQLIEEIAASPLEDTEIPITVKLTPPSGAGSAVEARVYLSAQKLFTSHAVDEWTSNFEVLFFQLTAKNKILDVATQNVRLAFAQAKYSEALKRGINTEQQLKFKPGAAVLYVIVHDKRTDAVGSVRIPLNEYSANPAPN